MSQRACLTNAPPYLLAYAREVARKEAIRERFLLEKWTRRCKKRRYLRVGCLDFQNPQKNVRKLWHLRMAATNRPCIR